MIRRRRSSGPRLVSAEQDNALRTALFAAAESVEPGDDGLARIRAKIVAGQTKRAQWRFGGRAAGEPWWRSLLPPRGWLPAVVAAVADRFRPDPNRAGWFGWLRPAAAVSTGLFVVTAASWAVAALPAAIAPNGGTGGSVKPPAPTRTQHPKKSHSPGFTPSGSGSAGPSGQPGGKGGGGGAPPTGTPSCSPPGSPSTAPSGTPSTTGTPSLSASPTPTTPTGTDSTSPAPDESSTSSPTPGSAPSSGSGSQPSQPTPGSAAMAPASAASPEATGKVLISRGRGRGWSSSESGRQFRAEVVRATLVGGTTVSPSPNPLGTPVPTASPTVGGPEPTPTINPTVPPVPCP
ncbi:MAG TPA: hypothetical protein VGM14_05850 [Streptosporangiaceae bacterium]